MNYPVKVDPKAYFSVERTFLHWGGLSVTMVALGIALQASSSVKNITPPAHGSILGRKKFNDIGLIYYVLASAFLIFPYMIYRQRVRGLQASKVTGSEVYVSFRVPFMLCSFLILLMLIGAGSVLIESLAVFEEKKHVDMLRLL